MSNQFEPFNLGEVLRNAAVTNRMNQESEIQNQESKIKAHAIAGQMARGLVSRMKSSGIPEGTPEFQSMLDRLGEPMRQELTSLGIETHPGPVDWNSVQALAFSGIGGQPRLHSTIPGTVGGKNIYVNTFAEGDAQPVMVNGQTVEIPAKLTADLMQDPYGNVQPRPGAPESRAALAGAETKAKEQNKIVEGRTPDNRQVYWTGGEATGQAPIKTNEAPRTGYDPSDPDVQDALKLIPNLGKIESGWNHLAVSPKGAFGVTQFMEETGKRYGVDKDSTPGQLIDASIRYLVDEKRRLGSWPAAISTYHGGYHGGQITDPDYVNAVMNGVKLDSHQNNYGRPVGPSLAETEAVKTQAELQRKAGEQQIEAATAGDIAKQKQIGEAQGKAASQFNDAKTAAEYSLALINKALTHPGLSDVVGAPNPLTGIYSPPGTNARDFKTLMAQLKGRAFLQAFDSLKGGGQITEVEGQKATEAIARLDTAQSEAEFKAALKELGDILKIGINNAGVRAGNQQATGEPSTGKVRFLGFE